MAPGLPVTAHVLSSISSLVSQIQICITGLKNFRPETTRRFWLPLQDRVTSLITQRTRLLNNVVGIVRVIDVLQCEDYDVRELLETGQIPAAFEDGQIVIRFDELLGDHQDSFYRHVRRLRRTLVEIEAEIGEENNHLEVDTSSQEFLRLSTKKARRIRKTYLSDAVHGRLISNLKQVNSTLDLIRQDFVNEAHQGREATRNAGSQPLKRLRARREHARNLFEAFCSPHHWCCQCDGRHNILLKLEPNNYQSSGEISYKVSVPTCELFSVLQSFSIRPSQRAFEVSLPSSAERTSSTLEMDTEGYSMQYFSNVKTSQSTPYRLRVPPVLPHPEAASRTREKATKQELEVRADTANTNETSLRRVELYQDSGGYSERISDICKVFRNIHRNMDQPEEIGYMTSNGRPWLRYDLKRIQRSYLKNRVLTLNSTDCHVGFHNRRDKLDHGYDWSRRERLLMATTIASDAFLLQGNWLRDDWSCHDIVVPLSVRDKIPLTTEMQVIVNFDSLEISSSKLLAGRQISYDKAANYVLEPLGYALCNILLGHSGKAPITQNKRSLQDSLRELEEGYGCLPGSVAYAVRECFAWLGPISEQGFDDERFSSDVFEKIIWPIIENYEIFCGNTSGILKYGHQYGSTQLDGNSRAVFGDVQGDLVYQIYTK